MSNSSQETEKYQLSEIAENLIVQLYEAFTKISTFFTEPLK
ncbi:MAG: hypothetical protein SWJ54_02210 [Cyanobacteriota bacterium]|nr:hypothetical protein [Cyanobacteriota bacterium]